MEMNEYTELLQSDQSWLPGKEAIINDINRCYGITPHFVDIQDLASKNLTLNGIFLYKDGKDCIKLTTCGLSQIAPSIYAFGRDRSGWGVEVTAAIQDSDVRKLKLCTTLLVQLAQYVNIRKTMFTEYSCINLSRLKCCDLLAQCNIAGIVFVRDTKLRGIETVHGTVEFLQLVGVDSSDWDVLRKTPSLVRQYVHDVRKVNSNLCMDSV